MAPVLLRARSELPVTRACAPRTQSAGDSHLEQPLRGHAPAEAVTGVILAGGQARRMGGRDKGLVSFRGRPLVDWVIVAGLRPQVAALAINANRNEQAYAALGYPVIADRIEGFQGPLAGFASAMAAAGTPWIVTVPCDGPFLAPDLVERLCAALGACRRRDRRGYGRQAHAARLRAAPGCPGAQSACVPRGRRTQN